MYVLFTSDGSNTYTGFYATLSYSSSGTTCSSASSSTLYVGSAISMTAPYATGLSCGWTVYGSSGYYPVITFSNINTLSTDYITIYDGSSSSSNALARLSGSYSSISYTGSGSYLYVTFSSGSTRLFNGGFYASTSTCTLLCDAVGQRWECEWEWASTVVPATSRRSKLCPGS